MSSEHSTLGTCPRCHADIPRGMVLIEYESEGTTAVYAECPECTEPVQPE